MISDATVQDYGMALRGRVGPFATPRSPRWVASRRRPSRLLLLGGAANGGGNFAIALSPAVASRRASRPSLVGGATRVGLFASR